MSFQAEADRFEFNQFARSKEISDYCPGLAIEMMQDTNMHLAYQHRQYNRKHPTFACGIFAICLLLLSGTKPMAQPSQKLIDFDVLIASGDKCRKEGNFDQAHDHYSEASYLSDGDEGWKAISIDRWQKLDKARKDAQKCATLTNAN